MKRLRKRESAYPPIDQSNTIRERSQGDIDHLGVSALLEEPSHADAEIVENAGEDQFLVGD